MLDKQNETSSIQAKRAVLFHRRAFFLKRHDPPPPQSTAFRDTCPDDDDEDCRDTNHYTRITNYQVPLLSIIAALFVMSCRSRLLCN
jgi:hypothetical protein